MSVTTDEFFAWLAEHGVDKQNVRDVRLAPAGLRSPGTVVMQVTTFALNEKGEKYLISEFDPSDNSSTRRMATEVRMIPLKSLPGAGEWFHEASVRVETVST